MATQTLTADNFASTVNDNEIVLVDFWADWCGPCKQFGPIYDAASAEHSDIVFGKVDTEAEQALGQALNITSIPTVMAFRDQIMVFAQSGAMPPNMLSDLIQQIRDLPMDEIRAKIAEDQANGGGAEA